MPAPSVGNTGTITFTDEDVWVPVSGPGSPYVERLQHRGILKWAIATTAAPASGTIGMSISVGEPAAIPVPDGATLFLRGSNGMRAEVMPASAVPA